MSGGLLGPLTSWVRDFEPFILKMSFEDGGGDVPSLEQLGTVLPLAARYGVSKSP